MFPPLRCKEGGDMEERVYTLEEILQRKDRACQARKLIMECMKIEAIEDGAMMTRFQNFFLQISISELHPLIVFCFARSMTDTYEDSLVVLNELNLKSVYGSHAINEQANCYIYRATYWLDAELDRQRFLEILERFSEEAQKGFRYV